ncbi:twin-arginine translocation signal domain-containing protein (plasmid) [Curtobacterium sp. TC1]|uniref:poly(ethylene terephthalate) hydrolase family protein n=1 Tax=Curtobacterium sp. TC1 TaxID=2862880 RepID=UPI001C9A5038|nr:twin-arginine translocation signal domain-containing protein [Curtobacterium sp. TC1]QZQ53674.1 twin-arginine translocation signal domain-containing protein [Curtobacterium sp. TC1]
MHQVDRRSFMKFVTAASILAGVSSRTFTEARDVVSLPDIERWKIPGPHKMSVLVQALSTIYYPSDISADDPRPVIIWGNGTGAVPVVYRGLFKHWVSYGYVVAAANTPNAALGLLMRQCIDSLERQNEASAGLFAGALRLDKIASSGHSQGGQAAINAAIDPRVRTLIPIQPGPLADVALISTPMLLLTGTSDVIVYPPLYVERWMRDRARGPMVYGSLRGATHFESVSTKDDSGFASVTTAWLEAVLNRNGSAARQFFGPDFGFQRSPMWTGVTRNTAAERFLPNGDNAST